MQNGHKTPATTTTTTETRPTPRSGVAQTSPRNTEIDAATGIQVNIAGGTQSTAIPPRTLPETFNDEREDVLAVINELEDQLDRYEEIRARLERELSEANEQSRLSRTRVQELEWQIVTLQTKIEQQEGVQREVTLLEEELADANTRAQRLTEQTTQLEKDNIRVVTELKTAHKQLEELWATRQERDGLRSDAKTLRAKVEQAERSIREFGEERTTLQAKLNDAVKSLDDTRAAKNRVELEVRTASDRIDEYQRIIEALEQKVELGKREKKTLQAQVTHLERDNARLQEQTQFFECELASLRSMNRNAESTLAHVKQAFSEVRVALSETKARARRRTIEGWPRGAAVPTAAMAGSDSDEG